MLIRPESAGDVASIHSVVAAAFGRPDEANLVDALRRDVAFIPQLSLVAEDGGTVIGHILFTRIVIRPPGPQGPRASGQSDSDLATAALALAPLAVAPAQQNHGVGMALSRHGLEVARQLGHRLVVVLGHANYYPRFGFVPALPRGIEAPFPVNPSSFMVCELQPGAIDGVRGTVEYAAPFAQV